MRGSVFSQFQKHFRKRSDPRRRKENCTVLSGDKADDHTSGCCLVGAYSCTYSPDKFHCLWYKTPSGTGNLGDKQESI